MNVVLFTWNPEKFVLSDRDWNRRIKQVRDSGFLYDQWSTGNSTKVIQAGDIAFLLRQTLDRGIVAKGDFLTPVFQDLTWNNETEDDEVANYVEIRWTEIVSIEKRLRHEKLEQEIADVNWIRYASGTTVDPQAHNQLLSLWTETLKQSGEEPPSHSRRRLPSKEVLDVQNGLCCICGIDSLGMYSKPPEELLVLRRLPGEDQDLATCPNCERFSQLHPEATTRSALSSMLASHY